MTVPFVELEVGERIVKVTNPDKVLFPKARKTKLDLVEYYLAVGDGIVRALYERPTQLRRFPDGVTGEAIYQKRVPEKRPDWVEAARVTFPSGRHADELCVTELAQVAWAANLAVVDFHPWPSRRRDTEHPDELRIDIDPSAGPRPPAAVGSTSSAASSRGGSSRSSGAPRSRSPARSSVACRGR
jgi:DNA primase